MSRNWIRALCALLMIQALAGCATHKDKVLPHGDTTMLTVWNQHTGGASGGRPARELLDARQVLRRPLTEAEATHLAATREAYTREAENEITAQFKRLPNPDLLMYVFAHLAGTERVPVPGYSTIFSLYERVQYALPGERTEEH